MIQIDEYKLFCKLEHKVPYSRVLSFMTEYVKLNDGQSIFVHSRSSPFLQDYDFVLTVFGVVKFLNVERRIIGTSPLCEELNKALGVL